MTAQQEHSVLTKRDLVANLSPASIRFAISFFRGDPDHGSDAPAYKHHVRKNLQSLGCCRALLRPSPFRAAKCGLSKDKKPTSNKACELHKAKA